jgi:hypothetical protein
VQLRRVLQRQGQRVLQKQVLRRRVLQKRVQRRPQKRVRLPEHQNQSQTMLRGRPQELPQALQDQILRTRVLPPATTPQVHQS